LIENKLALGAASHSWNSTYINKVTDTLPIEHKQRYVLHSETGQKSILPVGTRDIPLGYETRQMEILDLGCGKGRILYDMTRYTGGRGFGINNDVAQLKNAMQFALRHDLWPNTLNFIHGTLNEKLPFENESLDFVYEVGAFTYLIDKLAVFQEIFRVLRPGGAFGYIDWTLLEGYDPTDPEQVEKLLKIKKLSGLIELHNPVKLATVAEKAGFEVIWNKHGGLNADPASSLLSSMQGSFRFADLFMNNLIRYKILPSHLTKAWRTLRSADGKLVKQSMEEKWLDVGHVFLIRKPHS